jgi:hypothetical protein
MTKVVPYTQEKRLYGDKRVVCRVVHCAYPDCKAEHAFHLTSATGGIPMAVWHKMLIKANWEVTRGIAFCPDHHRDVTRAARLAAAERGAIIPIPVTLPDIPVPIKPKETPMAEPPTPIRTLAELGEATAQNTRLMTPEFRRRINREIFGNWDEVQNRYMGGMSDQKIATDLGVPRAWVEQVRVENFGDSGGNEEIEELREDIDKAIATFEPMVRQAQTVVENCVAVVGKMETQLSDLKALKKRVERAEAAVLPRRA